ncbi:DegT/DnrJ/EryC1/StrS family aminotransferase [Acidobacteria bacterium AH-259-L09]|nr:DegT/DnrJ/EryC1/StrS family aminotransferase [Acidobacteria bacterium AH-259-L09]
MDTIAVKVVDYGATAVNSRRAQLGDIVAIALNDLKHHNQSIFQEIQIALERVLSRGQYVLGPELESFEAEFASYCGVDHCVGVGNGTDALELALRALDVSRGDKVATVANAGMYSTTAISAVGALPLYVDVDPATMNMDPNALATALSGNVQAIIITHLYGQMAEMPHLIRIASAAGIPVVEDCAQAHGAHLNGKRAGAWGSLGCFSFYPTKNLGALGDAGGVVTRDLELAERLRMLRQYGWEAKYQSVLAGGRNSRLDEIQAAILRAKLPYLEGWNERRRKIAKAYTEGLADLDLSRPSNFGTDYVAHLYVVSTPFRDQLAADLAGRGVRTEIHYPTPDHLQESVRGMSSADWDLPVTEQLSREILTLPCFPEMTKVEVEQVIEAVRRVLG